MQILIVSSGLADKYGGAPLSESALANSLYPSANVIVLCPRDRHDPKFSRRNINCPVLDFSRADVVRALGDGEFWLSRLFQTSSLLHLNGHWRWENFLLARLARRHAIPYLLHPRGMLVLNRRRPILKRLFNFVLGNEIVRGASQVIALSTYEVNQFTKYGVVREKISVIPNGIPDPTEWITEPAEKANRYFLYLGRIDPRKNLLFLLQAFSEFASHDRSQMLYLMGPIEKDYDEELERAISLLGINQNVKILSPAYGKEKWQLLRSATAVVYPAVDEAFGRVPFEAVASGSFPIVPKESGGADYLKPYLPFCLYQQGNLPSLVDTMVQLASATTEQRQSLFLAKDWVRYELNWNRIAEKMLSLYGNLIDENERQRDYLTNMSPSSIP